MFLPDLHEEDWERLIAHTERRRFEAGDVVIRAGELDRSLSIVVSGALELFLPGADDRPFLTMVENSVVGEMAFLDGRPRSATLRARTAGELLRLSFDSFEMLSARFPKLGRAILLDLGRILARRLEHMNEEFARLTR